MLEAGEAGVEQIDRAIIGAGYPMGPFALMDLVGIDVNYAVATRSSTASTAPSASVPRRSSSELVEAGRLGRKSGEGFYLYEDGELRSFGPPARSRRGRSARRRAAARRDRPAHRAAIINEAYHAAGDGVADAGRHRPCHEAGREPPVTALRACRPTGSARRYRRPGRLRGDDTESATASRRCSGRSPRSDHAASGPTIRAVPRQLNRALREAWIVSAVRTPVGRYGGALARVRPDDLAATAIKAAVERSGVAPARRRGRDPGRANQAGEDNRNVARMAALLAGLPDRGGRPDGQPAVRLWPAGDQLGGSRDHGRRRRRLRRRRRGVDDTRAVCHGQGRVGL